MHVMYSIIQKYSIAIVFTGNLTQGLTIELKEKRFQVSKQSYFIGDRKALSKNELSVNLITVKKINFFCT